MQYRRGGFPYRLKCVLVDSINILDVNEIVVVDESAGSVSVLFRGGESWDVMVPDCKALVNCILGAHALATFGIPPNLADIPRVVCQEGFLNQIATLFGIFDDLFKVYFNTSITEVAAAIKFCRI